MNEFMNLIFFFLVIYFIFFYFFIFLKFIYLFYYYFFVVLIEHRPGFVLKIQSIIVRAKVTGPPGSVGQ